MTLRDALVAPEQRMRNASDHGYSFEDAEVRVALSNELAEILAAHPAVEGDAVTVACEAYAAADHAWTDAMCRPEEPRPTFAMRAALDAAWPGMVADSARLDWLSESSNLAHDIVVNGYGSLRERIDSAIAMEAKP